MDRACFVQNAIHRACQPIRIEQSDFTPCGLCLRFQTMRDDRAKLVEQTKQSALLVLVLDGFGAAIWILAETDEVGLRQDQVPLR